MDHKTETKRIREVYSERDETVSQAYTWLQSDIHATIFTVDYTMARLLVRGGLSDLGKQKILDLGCGQGRWLRVLNEWGASASNLFGVDLNPDRIAVAKSKSPNINFKTVSGQSLPFEDNSFDLVSAKTVFSSILNPEHRMHAAQLMIKACKTDGKILIFDFRISNPKNKNTIGITPRELQRLFPSWKVFSKSVLLAPPIHRRLCKISPSLAVFVEYLIPILRTHSVYLLEKA